MSELQTPKSKRQEQEQEEGNNVGSREEQEQALVALVEHRSAEIDRLKHHISNYQTKVLFVSSFPFLDFLTSLSRKWYEFNFFGGLSQLIEAQRSLRDSKAKLANLRGHDDDDLSIGINSAKNDESTRNVTPSRRDYPSPSPSKILKPSAPLTSSNSSISKSKANNTVVVKQKPETSSRDSFSNSKTKTVRVKQTPSRDSPNLKASRDQDRGTKRKFGKFSFHNI